MLDIDDKDLVIAGVVAICILSILKLPADQAATIIENAFYGLFGIGTGYSMRALKDAKKRTIKPPKQKKQAASSESDESDELIVS